MLSAQHRDLAEKKNPSPYPKNDFSRWNAFDYFKRSSRFKAFRFWLTVGATALVTLCCLVSIAIPKLHGMHQAAPISTAHAMFNQNCANCHVNAWAPLARAFGSPDTVSVSDKTCNGCHYGSPHNPKVAHDPSCVSCHREHTGHDQLVAHVASRQCVECHQELSVSLHKGIAKPDFHAKITNFNLDHPEFKHSAPGERDDAQVKFSHETHLGLAIDELRRGRSKSAPDALSGIGSKLACIDCHQSDDERHYIKPIRYDLHCARCHHLNVALSGKFTKDLDADVAQFSQTPLPHAEPAIVRAVLRDRLVEFARKHALVSAKPESVGPSRRLPWKLSPEISDDQWTWTTQEGKKADDLLFSNKQWTRADPLTYCSHCHIEKKPGQRVDGLPTYHQTAIPTRWHVHSVFSHGAHRTMTCTACHDQNAAMVKVANSKNTKDVLLPTIQICQNCHRDSGSARNGCVECHRYHDRSLDRDTNGTMEMLDVVRKNRPVN